MKSTITKPLLLLLAAISAISPFAVDTYLSSIPSIASELNTSTSLVAVTVSLYVLGMAIGQLIGGPLSDKFGRRPIMMVGLTIFALGSLLISTVVSLESLWLYRIIQALGGGIAVVGIPAIIRDNSSGKASARLFSLIMLIMLITMIAPSIAPSFGTLILKTLGWQWIFIIMGILALTIVVCTHYIMPVTSQTKVTTQKSRYRDVFKQYKAMGYLVTQAFSYAVLMSFLTNAAFVYIEHFHTSETLFSLLLMLSVVGVVLIHRVNSWLLNHYDPQRLVLIFLALQTVGITILILSTLFMPDKLWFVVAGFIIIMGSMGGIMPNSGACFMDYFEKGAGTASATLGTSQYVVASLVSALAALLLTQTLWPLLIILLLSNILATTGAWVGLLFHNNK